MYVAGSSGHNSVDRLTAIELNTYATKLLGHDRKHQQGLSAETVHAVIIILKVMCHFVERIISYTIRIFFNIDFNAFSLAIELSIKQSFFIFKTQALRFYAFQQIVRLIHWQSIIRCIADSSIS